MDTENERGLLQGERFATMQPDWALIMFVGSTLIIPAARYTSSPSDCCGTSPCCEEQLPARINSNFSGATEAPNDHFPTPQAAPDLIWSACGSKTNIHVLLFNECGYFSIIILKDVKMYLYL